MPSYNVTIQDVSPLFNYQGRWHDSETADPKQPLYSDGTFHATQATGSSTTLDFQGTGVYLYGAKRNNHGDYSVSVDEASSLSNGYSSDPEEWWALLHSESNLIPGQHTLVATNQGKRDRNENPMRVWFDVDFAYVTAGDGDTSTTSSDVILDDTASNITYSGSWEDWPNPQADAYYGKTMHRTNTTDSSASISFYGNAISVYGAVSGNHGDFAVSLDGEADTKFSGHSRVFRPQTILYFANGLELKEHTLVLRHADSNESIWFDLDQVVVSTWSTNSVSSSSISFPHPSSAPTPGPAQTTSSTSHSNGGKIAGAVIGTILALSILAGLLLFFLRRRAQNQRRTVHQSRARESVPRTWPEKSEAWTAMRERMRRVSHYGQ